MINTPFVRTISKELVDTLDRNGYFISANSTSRTLVLRKNESISALYPTILYPILISDIKSEEDILNLLASILMGVAEKVDIDTFAVRRRKERKDK